MHTWLKITIGITAALLIVGLTGGIIFYNMLTESLPKYEGEIRTAGIHNPVEVYRDSSGVPYIKAGSDEDAAFALGYVHAQERMFSMDLARRAGEGRLSEVLGEKTLPFDKLFRTAGIKKYTYAFYKKINPEAQKFLQAYSRGVNLYLKEAKGNFPVEFDILGYEPYEWKPEHSLIIAKMMAWEMNIAWWVDFSYTKLAVKFGEEKIREILPDYPENSPVIVEPHIKRLDSLNTHFMDTDKAFRKFMGKDGTHIGSNNWVVSGTKSESGKPIIANDTHLGYSMPGKWFAAVIKSPGWTAAGFTLPGIPGVVSGKNDYISWTVTNIMADDADFYIEKIDSSGKNYMYNGSWRPLVQYKETIKIKDKEDFILRISETVHGPIVTGIHPFSFLYEEDKVNMPPVSMKWLGNEFSDEMWAFMRINKAKNWNEFRSALETYSVPGQNFVYGDNGGNIGYVFGGRVPVRSVNSATLLLDGTTDQYDWRGFVPKSELPVIFNPDAGYLASANNKTSNSFPHYISNMWEPSSRIDRITGLLTSKQKHSVNDYKQYQNDFVSPYAGEITGYILQAFENIKVTDKNLKLSLELFDKWDYRMGEFSQVPAIYAVFLKHLMSGIYKDEMGEDLYNEFVFVANIPYRSLTKILKTPSLIWFDDINTKAKLEDRDDIIRRSLADALTELESKFGPDLKDWQWGKLHQFKMKHPFSGVSGMLDEKIDIGPFPIGGDGTTLFNTEYPFNKSVEGVSALEHDDFENNLGPAMRFIFDFAEPDKFYMILTSGQSGNVMSPHYKDMNEKWLNGRYIEVSTGEASFRKDNNYLLKIIPD